MTAAERAALADVAADLAAADLAAAAVACRAAAGGASLVPVIAALSSSLGRLVAIIEDVPAVALDVLLSLPDGSDPAHPQADPWAESP